MSSIKKLQLVNNSIGLAELLRVEDADLVKVLLAPQEYYHSFSLPKKDGSDRKIDAPRGNLKIIQKRIASLLNECVLEISKERPGYLSASYGFMPKKSIILNALKHKDKRYVFNLDLKDFFGTITVARIEGFFRKDTSFMLTGYTAQAIALLVTYKKKLPQGSPCSPIISNLLGNILDRRLVQLSKLNKSYYTRYADDLTFSANIKSFPKSIAFIGKNGWEVGAKLRAEIKKSGYKINYDKTRMGTKSSRQMVTGLVVNKKVNILRNYYRKTRSMTHQLFENGKYYTNPDNKKNMTVNINYLDGRWQFISSVKFNYKNFPSEQDQKKADQARSNLKFKEKPDKENKGIIKILRRFYYYKLFANLANPLIITEGISDINNLSKGIDDFKQMKNETLLQTVKGNICKEYIKLYKIDFEKVRTISSKLKEAPRIRFLKRDKNTLLGAMFPGGSDTTATVLENYKRRLSRFKKIDTPSNPVILIFDNDRGSDKAFRYIERKSIKPLDNTDIYFLKPNLYIFKLPLIGNKEATTIEDYIPGDDIEEEEKIKKSIETLNDKDTYLLSMQEILERVIICIEYQRNLELKMRVNQGK